MRENSFIPIHYIYEEKIKQKTVKLQMKKKTKAE